MAAKPNKQVRLVADDDDEKPAPAPKPRRNEVQTTRGVAIEQDDGRLQVEAEAEALKQEDLAPAVATVEVAPVMATSRYVTIVMLDDIDPAPTIGQPSAGGFNFLDHGIIKLEKNKNYQVPKNVANVLLDKRKASIISLA